MRNIEEYEEKELGELTDQEVENIIRWHCAEEGVKFLRPPEKKVFESIQVPKEDVAYTVSHTGFHFSDRAVAEELANWLQRNRQNMFDDDYDYGMGYDYKYLIPFGSKYSSEREFAVSEERFYDRETLKQKDTILKQRKIEKERYEQENKEYQDSSKHLQEISEMVWEKVCSARSRKRAREKFRGIVDDYIQLANGDVEQARKFFEKAYPGSEFRFEDLLSCQQTGGAERNNPR